MIFFVSVVLCIKLATLVCAANENSSINCPRFCNCDSYQQLNRAQCSSRNIISAELVLPHQVQILDLSYNVITTLDSKCFGNFTHLKYLNLSHNAVHSLDWNTFFKLRKLTEINLSYNRLEYLDDRLFVRNKYLNKINLAGNKIRTLENKPLLKNPFVSVIILQNSQINLLQPHLFVDLKSLKYLDLSKNLLNNFNTEDFQHLERLQELNLSNNFITCNQEIRNKMQKLENKGIKVYLEECKSVINVNSQQQEQKFEKLVMIKQEEKDQNFAHKNNQWRFNLDSEEEIMEDDKAEEEFDYQEVTASHKTNKEWLQFALQAVLCEKSYAALCHQYQSCLQDLSKAWHNQQQLSPPCSVYDIKFAFVMGVAIGVAIIVIIMACALCLKRCLEAKKSATSVIDNAEDLLPNQPLARPISQLPPQVRRQTRRRAPRPARSLVRYEGPVTENFISRLFGRPARHQYYRSINQNTATLIRRLSRSNLFNNRLSQHFMESQRSAEASSTAEQGFSATAPRPETPPPSYREVVVKNVTKGK